MAQGAPGNSVRRVAIAVAALIVCVGLITAAPVLRLDGPSGVYWSLLLTADTEYARGYTHRRFLRLAPGMTQEEVRALVGEPLLARRDTGVERWWYSRSPKDTNYRFRMVIFDANGVVTEVASEFYVD